MKKPKNFDLEDRLIDFSIRVSRIIDQLPQDKFVNYLSSQLLRSSTSVALNYGEAQGAELENTINESKELIAIFIKSIETAERNRYKRNKN